MGHTLKGAKMVRRWVLMGLVGGMLTGMFGGTPAYAKSDESEERVTVLFFELKAVGGITKTKVRLLENIVVGELHKYKKFNVLSRSDVERLIDSDAFKQSLDCSTTSCLVDVAGALGTGLVVGGEVGYIDEDTAIVSLQVIQTQDSEVRSRVTSTLKGKGGDLIPQMQEAVRELIVGYDPSYGGADVLSKAPPGSVKEGGSILRKWWFWTGLGVIAVGAGVAAATVMDGGGDSPPPATGTWAGTVEVGSTLSR